MQQALTLDLNFMSLPFPQVGTKRLCGLSRRLLCECWEDGNSFERLLSEVGRPDWQGKGSHCHCS
jgi:hypothetical protein